LIQNT